MSYHHSGSLFVPLLNPLGVVLFAPLHKMVSWFRTSHTHIRNLTGFAITTTTPASPRVFHLPSNRYRAAGAGDKINVEVEVEAGCDEGLWLNESHDLGDSLQLESVPVVERAFVHLHDSGWNLPGHLAGTGRVRALFVFVLICG